MIIDFIIYNFVIGFPTRMKLIDQYKPTFSLWVLKLYYKDNCK